MFRGKYFAIPNFKGGYCGNNPLTQLQLNQAADLDNIVIGSEGRGFRSRKGNATFVATTFNSGANVQGIGYLLTAAQSTYIGTVVGNKFYRVSDATDYTGALSITTGADNQWSLFTFQDTLVGFGGSPTSPDVPFSWPGTGNAVVLTGTPPSAYGGFSANNRVFAFRTNANPSTIYWSIIGSANDWTGAGSGNAVVGSFSDNQRITGAVTLSTNYVLLFKEASTYQMVISAAPFPIYSMFDSVGCVGKNACLALDGAAYWINQRGRMSSTDGENYKEYPPVADDLWNAVQKGRYPYINGFRQKGIDYDWIVWMVSTTGSTNNTTIIWDLINECWLKCSTGYKFNVSAKDNNNTVYLGGYNGKIYNPDVAATYADASESSPGTIAAYWRSGWMNFNTPEEIMQVRRFVAQYLTKASGTVNVNYGFDFVPDGYNFTFAQTPVAAEVITSKRQELVHRGNFFQFKIGSSSSTIDMAINSVTLGGKIYGQKKLSSS
jgi:hypothetical protein